MTDLYNVYLAIAIPMVIAFGYAYYEIGLVVGYW